MSLRYIVPILSLSISSVLCSADAFDTTNSSGNPDFNRLSSDSFKDFLLPNQVPEIFVEESPHAEGHPNTPVSRSGSLFAKPQSNFLNDLMHVITMQTCSENIAFNNLSNKARAGLNYRNNKILDTVSKLILKDLEFANVDKTYCDVIANAFVMHIKNKLDQDAAIWEFFPVNLKESIIAFGPCVRGVEVDGFWFQLLDDGTTLEEYACYAGYIEESIDTKALPDKKPMEIHSLIPRCGQMGREDSF
ncbi:MAG: hypothetical protein COY39_01215 [Alphaproteobacteria bacterium CG_4_10_14_0_8_um_filter_37_21]|nr:MAG: hypothetical protein COY39_01215 [Alphaproteobacteria bacterium CG_4_10_14_0_8_um_filter_37_21]